MVIPADMKSPVLLALDRACLSKGSIHRLIEAFSFRPPIVFNLPDEGLLYVRRIVRKHLSPIIYPFVVDLHAKQHNVTKSVFGQHNSSNEVLHDEEESTQLEIEPQAEEIPTGTSAGVPPPSADRGPTSVFHDNPSAGRTTYSCGHAGARSTKVPHKNPVPMNDGIHNTYAIGGVRPDNSERHQTRGMFVGSRDEPATVKNLGHVNDCWRNFDLK